MSDFPPAGMTSKEDSKYFEVSQEDPAIRTSTDGGYQLTRPRYTRRPRRVFKTGFTQISEADRALLETFWNTQLGGSKSFTWTIPTTLEEVTVRFEEEMDFKYKGVGGTHYFDVTSIKLREV